MERFRTEIQQTFPECNLSLFSSVTKFRFINHHHHHHHKSVMQLAHLLTRSGLTYPEVSSKVYQDSFCQLGSSVSLHWVSEA